MIHLNESGQTLKQKFTQALQAFFAALPQAIEAGFDASAKEGSQFWEEVDAQAETFVSNRHTAGKQEQTT